MHPILRSVLGLLVVLVTLPTFAQATFGARFSANLKGDIVFVSNASMTCSLAPAAVGVGTCSTVRMGGPSVNGINNNYTMTYIDIDNDASTFNSTSAQLAMPAGSSVAWAGLYWAGDTNAAARNTVKIQGPNASSYTTLTASQVTGVGTAYQGFIDVTAYVAAQGNGNYTVANVASTNNTRAVYAGWTFVVAYQNTSLPTRNMVVYDGYQRVTGGGSVNVSLSGFLTPPLGTVTSRIGTIAYDGDRGSVESSAAMPNLGGLMFGPTATSLSPVSNPQNPQNDYFNSTISRDGANVSTRNPGYTNTFGYDADISQPNTPLPNGATTAVVRVSSTSETIDLGVVTMVTDIFVPNVKDTLTKKVTDINGVVLLPGDILEYELAFGNSGQDPALNVVLQDIIPANTTYVPGSLTLVSGANSGAKTDAAGDDQAEFDAAGNQIVVRAGVGATATTGGKITPGDAFTVIRFRVKVNPGVAGDTVIENSAKVTFKAQTLGTTMSDISDSDPTQAGDQPTAIIVAGADVSISKSHIGDFFAGQTGQVYTINVSNVGTAPTNAPVQVVDTLPSGLTATAIAGGSNWGCVLATLTCTHAGVLAVGQAAPPIIVTVNVAINAPASVVNTATVSGGGEGASKAGNNSVKDPTTIVQGFPVRKAFNPAAVSTTQPSTLSITITNPSTLGAMTGVAVTDVLPAGLVLAPTPNASSSGCGSVVFTPAAGAVAVNATAATVASNSSCVLNVDVVAAASGSYTNTIPVGGVSSTNFGSNNAPAAATLTVAAPDLSIVKTSNSPFYQGQTTGASFTLAANNVGSGATVGAVTVNDTLPTGLTPLTASGTGWACTITGQAVSCSRGDALAAGAAYPAITVTASVAANAALTMSNTATVTGGGEPIGSDKNNSSTVPVVILAPPTVSKSFTPSVINLGGTSVMVITVSNPNAQAIQGLSLTDTYPANLLNLASPAAVTNCTGGALVAAANTGSAVLTGASLPANGSCTITATVGLSAAGGTGAYVNTIAAGAVNTNNAGSNVTPASATLSVSAPDLTLSKTHTGSFYVGQSNAMFTLTASNNGAGGNGASIGQVTVTDTLPAGLVPLSATGAGWGPGSNACSIAGQVVSCLRSDVLAYGAGYPAITLTVQVNAGAAPSVVNTASVSGGAEPAANSGNNTASDTVTVLSRPTVSKAFAVSNTSLSTPVSMTITISNPNAVAMTGVALSDAYPAALQNAPTPAATSSCGGTVTAAALSSNLSLSGASIPANGSCVLTASVQATQVGSWTNTVPVGGVSTTNAGSNAAAASATLAVDAADLTLTKTHTGNFYQGQTGAVFTLTAKNSGAGSTAGVVEVTDTLPAGLTPTAAGGAGWGPQAGNQCSIAGQTVTCQYSDNSGVLAANATATFTITVNVASNAAASLTNNAAIAGGGELPSAQANNTASDVVTVLSSPKIAKSFTPIAASANQSVALAITLSNDNAIGLTGLAFTDALPSGVLASAISSNTCNGNATFTANSVTLVGGTLPANASCVITVAVSAAAPGVYVNTIAAGALSSAQAGVSQTTAQATLTVQAANLTIAKSHEGTFYQGQGNAVFTLQVNNAGAGATDGTPIVVKDTLPSGLSPVSATGTGWTCGFVGQTITCTMSAVLAAGGHAGPITVTVAVDAAAAATMTNTAVVSGGGEPAANDKDNTANDPVTVFANPVVSKSFSPALVNINQTSAMTVTIKNPNPNPNPITGLAFSDVYPAGLVNASVLNLQNTCGGTATASAGQGTLSLTGGTLAANASCTITVNVSAPAAGGYTNTIAAGAVSSTQAGSNAAPASATLNVAGPDLAIAKSHTGNFHKNQIGAQFQITVRNAGIGATAGAVTVTDTLPGTLTATAISGTGWTCTLSPLECSRSDSLPAGQAYPAITVTVNVSDVAAATETNRADVTGGGEPAANVNNNAATDKVVVLANPALVKSFTPVSINANNPSDLLITLGNSNSIDMVGAALTDTMPTGLTLLSTPVSNCGGTVTNTTTALTLAGGVIPANGTCTIRVPVTGSVSGSYTNTMATGALSSSNAGLNQAPAVASLTIAAPDLIVSKSHTGHFYQRQAAAVYTLEVKNIGAGATNGSAIVVNDVLPAGLTFMSASGTTWTCTSAIQCTYSAGAPLAVGASLPPITVTVSVAANAPSSIVNTASVSGGGEPAANATNNSGSDTAKILANPSVAKSFSPSSGNVGGLTRLTVTVTNPNDIAMTGVSFTDTYGGNLLNASTPAATSTCGGTVSASAGQATLVLSGGLIPAGATCEISSNVTTTVAGNHSNTIAADAVTSTNAGANQAPTSANYAAASPDLTIVKNHVSTFYQGQSNASFTLTVSNVGVSPTVGGASVIDTLPAGLSMVSMAGDGWTCLPITGPCSRTTNDPLPAGASYPVITVTVNVASNAAVNLTNTASVSNPNEPAANLANNSTTDTVTVLRNPSVSKAFSPPSIFANDVTTLTITVTNPNSVAITAVSVTDTLPAAISVASPANAISSCGGTVATAPLQLTGATIPALATCTLTVNVTASLPGDHVNTIPAGGVTSANAGNNATPAAATLTVLSPDLTISKSHTGHFFQGQNGVAYRLVVSNIGFVSSNGTLVTVTDVFPTGLTPVQASASGTGWACSVAAQTVSCSRSTVLTAGGAYPDITVLANVSATAVSVANTASVAGGGEAPSLTGNNTATDPTVILTPIQVSKAFSTSPITAGQTTNLLITLNNSNSTPISPVGLVDNMPSAIQVVGAPSMVCSGSVVAALGSSLVTISNLVIPGSSACVITVPVTSSSVGAWVNTIATSDVTPNIAQPAQATLTVNAPNLLISKSHTGTFYAGQVNAAFLLTVSNVGNADTTGVQVKVVDTLPAGLTPKAGSNGNGWTCAVLGQQLTCTRTGSAAILAQGVAFPPINVLVDVAANANGTYTNTATVEGGGEVDTSNNLATDTVMVLRGLSMTKQFAAASISPNQSTLLTITIINPNSVAATGVSLTDSFPSTPSQMLAVGLASTTCGGTAQVAPGNAAVSLLAGSVPANSNCTLTVNVTASTSGLYANVIPAANLTSTNAGSATVNAADSLTVAAPDWVLSKTAVNAPFYPGQTDAQFSLSARNIGNADALVGQLLTVTDTFPAGIVPTSVVATGWACSITAPIVRCTRSDALTSGASHPAITITATVAASATGTLTNTASTSGGGDNNPDNNTVNAAFDIFKSPVISKSFAPSSTQINQAVQLTIELKNSNTVALLNAAFTDTLPTGITLAATPAPVTTCGGTVTAVNLGTVVSGAGMIIPSAGCFVRVNVVAINPGVYTNIIPVGALTTSNGGASQVAAQAVLQVAAPDLVIAKRSNSVFWRGQISGASYLLSVSNIGGAATTNTVTVLDTLPSGLTPTQAQGTGWACTLAGQQVSCQRLGIAADSLAVGANYPDIVVQVNVARDAGLSIVNTASLSGGGEAPAVTGNNSATDIAVVNANPVVQKRFSPANMSLGQIATMEIVVSNPNASAMTGVAFSDSYPAGLINAATPNASATCSGTLSASAGAASLALSAATVAANSQCTIKVDVTTSSHAVPGAYVNSLPAGSVTSTNAGDNPIGASGTLVLATPDLTIVKTHTGDFYQRQSNAKYLLTVRNQGTGNTLGAVTVKDTLPAGLTPTAIAATGWACTIAAQLVSCSRSDGLQAGALWPVIEIAVTVAANASSSINTASVEGGGESLAAAQNNGAADPTTVLVNPTVVKSFASASAPINAPVMMAFKLVNTNNVAVTGLGFVDTLPAGMRLAPNAVVQNTCGGTSTLVSNALPNTFTLIGAALAPASECTVKVEVITTTTTALTNTIASDGLSSANAGGNAQPTSATLTGFVTEPTGYKAVVLSQDADASGAPSPGDVLDWVLIYANTQAGAIIRNNFQISDVLPAGAVLEGTPTITASGGATAASANANYTGLPTAANVLGSGAALDVGGVITVRLPVRILPNFEGVLSNQASASATGLSAPILSSALDASTPPGSLPPSVLAPNGSLPVPQTALLPATQVSVTMPSRVGTAKAVASSAQVSGSVQKVVYDVLIKNFGTQAAPNVQLQDSLALAFPAPVSFAVSTSPVLLSGAALPLNPAFNGTTDTRLLAGTAPLAPGASSIVRVTVMVTLNGAQTTFNNSSFASSMGGSLNHGGLIAAPTSAGGVPVFTPARGTASFDASNNAARAANAAQLEQAADPSSNGKPNDAGEDTPTPITLSFAAALRGTVWLDTTPNRLRDTAEQGVPNFGVEVINRANNAAVPCAQGVNTTLGCIAMPDGRSLFATNSSGNYEALGLPTGNYQVRFRDGANNIIYGTPTNSGNNPASSVAASRDALLVTLAPGDAVLEQNLPLDPSGVVYNSNPTARQPIAGAAVVFCGPAGFVPNTMLVGGSSYASVAGQSNCASMVVGSNGFYQFLLQASAPAGRYTLSASAVNFFGPSVAIPAQTNLPVLPPAPGFYAVQPQLIAPTGNQATTYYLTFNLSNGVQDVVNNHIPLDSLSNARLFVSKTVNQRSAEIGDSVEYTITVASPDSTLQGVNILDRLPLGFRLIPGTVRVNGVSVADPAGTPGPQLTYAIGTVSQAQAAKVVYRVRIAAGAQTGDGINRASARAAGGAVSNIAQAVVKVTGGVFTQEACVIGKVFVDCNGDAIQNTMDNGKFEPGIAGVRVYFENGSYAITDREGKYSVCGFSPSTHVAKVDVRTMPAGSVLVPFSNRNLMDGRSVMLDLRTSELHRADFIEGSCTPAMMNEVEKRKNLAPPVGNNAVNLPDRQSPASQGVKP